jgi:hypothetical protein
VSTDQLSEIPVGEPCKLCGAPAGMTCSDYMYLKQLNQAYDTIEGAFTSPEELASELLSASERMDRLGVPEVTT